MLRQQISPWSIYDDFGPSINNQTPPKSNRIRKQQTEKIIREQKAIATDKYLQNQRIRMQHQVLYEKMDELMILRLLKSQIEQQESKKNRHEEQHYFSLPKIQRHSNKLISNIALLQKSPKKYRSFEKKESYHGYSQRQLENLVKNNLQIGTVGLEQLTSPRKKYDKIDKSALNEEKQKLPSFSGMIKKKYLVIPNQEQLNEYTDNSIFQFFYSPGKKKPKGWNQIAINQSIFMGGLAQNDTPAKIDRKMENIGLNFYAGEKQDRKND